MRRLPLDLGLLGRSSLPLRNHRTAPHQPVDRPRRRINEN